jgi:hypothetical protein
MSQDYSSFPPTNDATRKAGLDRYFTGEACKHGHIAPRYVSTTNCVACQLMHARKNGGWKARPTKEAFRLELEKTITAKGGRLLSAGYEAARKKVEIDCGAGHHFAATPDNIKRGKWCPDCAEQAHAAKMVSKLRLVGELREFARTKHDGDCLATAPADSLTKVPWKCSQPDHPVFDAPVIKVLRGQWCPSCWNDRRLPPNPAMPETELEEYVKARGGEVARILTDKGWIGSKTRVEVRCANGHLWSADASNLIYAGSWCPECQNKGERIVRGIFEATFGETFPKMRPKTLKSTKGRLELDGYNEALKLAFEYQGPHHYSNPEVQAYDAIKREWCAKNDVRLIAIEATKKPFPVENVLEKVVEAFQRDGFVETPILPSGELFKSEFSELHALAASKGGTLVSPTFLGGDARHEWKCHVPEHPTWLAEPWRIRTKSWCPSCAGNRRLGIDRLREWGKTIGLELLDETYLGAQTPYHWRCAAGHEIKRTRPAILGSVACGQKACTACKSAG